MKASREIETAFARAIKANDKGQLVITTVDFVRELEVANKAWTLKQANQWIEDTVSTFEDISGEDGEQRTFSLFNLNGAL